jgi:hypothetical protein
VLLDDGTGVFGPKVDYSGFGGAVVAGDLNGDGRPDLAILVGDSVSLLLNRGDGSFVSGGSALLGGSGRLGDMVAADLNGDGKLDLALVDAWYNNVSVLIGNGDGTFAPLTEYGAGYNPVGLVVGDVNCDGRPDLLISGENAITVLLAGCP